MKENTASIFRAKDGESIFIRSVGRYDVITQKSNIDVAVLDYREAVTRDWTVTGVEHYILRYYLQNSIIICLKAKTPPSLESSYHILSASSTHVGSMSPLFLLTTVIVFLGFSSFGHPTKRREDKTKCPHVRAIRNFDLHEVTV